MKNLFPRLHRYLDPGDSLGELIFGLIMVLTFTLGTRLLAGDEPVEGATLMVAALGCNLAWGIIDAVLFVLSRVYERRRLATLTAFLGVTSPETAREALDNELAGVGALADEAERTRFYEAVVAASRRGVAPPVGLRVDDFYGAIAVFLLVVGTALPAIAPFLLIDDAEIALRASNAVLVALLFVIGWFWGRHVGTKPWQAGLIIMSLGAAMALIAIPLGG